VVTLVRVSDTRRQRAFLYFFLTATSRAVSFFFVSARCASSLSPSRRFPVVRYQKSRNGRPSSPTSTSTGWQVTRNLFFLWCVCCTTTVTHVTSLTSSHHCHQSRSPPLSPFTTVTTVCHHSPLSVTTLTTVCHHSPLSPLSQLSPTVTTVTTLHCHPCTTLINSHHRWHTCQRALVRRFFGLRIFG
jgi:hypothetical protein